MLSGATEEGTEKIGIISVFVYRLSHSVFWYHLFQGPVVAHTLTEQTSHDTNCTRCNMSDLVHTYARFLVLAQQFIYSNIVIFFISHDNSVQGVPVSRFSKISSFVHHCLKISYNCFEVYIVGVHIYSDSDFTNCMNERTFLSCPSVNLSFSASEKYGSSFPHHPNTSLFTSG